MGFEINWSCVPNSSIKQHPLYQKWSTKTLAEVGAAAADLSADMVKIRMDCESTEIMAYLSWLVRSAQLVA